MDEFKRPFKRRPADEQRRSRDSQKHRFTLNKTPPFEEDAESLKRPNTYTQKNKKNSPMRALLHKLEPILGWVLFFTILVGLAFGAFWYIKINASPVPEGISQKMDFPIFYPDPKKLPEGYMLDKDSFKTPQPDVVLYHINYDQKSLIVALQKQPTDNEIQTFYSNYIPLRNKIRTDLGEAEIGAHNVNSKDKENLKTIVSLPTYKGSWIIITAPFDIEQDKLKQTLNSFKE